MKNLLCGILVASMFFLFAPITYSDAKTGKYFKGAYLPLLDHDKCTAKCDRSFNLGESTTIRIVTVCELSNLAKVAASGEVDVFFVMCPVAAERLFSKPGFEMGESLRSEVEALAGKVRDRSLRNGDSLARGDGAESNEKISESLQKVINVRLNILRKYASDAFIINEVKKANTQKLGLDEIKKLDSEWISQAESEFVDNVLESDVSRFLRRKVLSNKLLYTEAFLCDAKGGTVGTYPRTSDYWQGDEGKFTECFKGGDGEVFVGPLEFDKSTSSHSVQVSVPVKDDGKTIGVLVVGLRNIK